MESDDSGSVDLNEREGFDESDAKIETNEAQQESSNTNNGGDQNTTAYGEFDPRHSVVNSEDLVTQAPICSIKTGHDVIGANFHRVWLEQTPQNARQYSILVPSFNQRSFCWPEKLIINYLETIRLAQERNSTCRFYSIDVQVGEVLPILAIDQRPEELDRSQRGFAYTILDGMHRLTMFHLTIRVCLHHLLKWAEDCKHDSSMNVYNDAFRSAASNLKTHDPGENQMKAYSCFNFFGDMQHEYNEYLCIDRDITNLLYKNDESALPDFSTHFSIIVEATRTINGWLMRYCGIEKMVPMEFPAMEKVKNFFYACLNKTQFDVHVSMNTSPQQASKEFVIMNSVKSPIRWEDFTKALINGSLPFEGTTSPGNQANHRALLLNELHMKFDRYSFHKRNNNTQRDMLTAVSSYFGLLLEITVTHFDTKFYPNTNIRDRIDALINYDNRESGGIYQTPENFIKRAKTLGKYLLWFLSCKIEDTETQMTASEHADIQEALIRFRVIMINPVNEIVGAIVFALHAGDQGELSWKSTLVWLKFLMAKYVHEVVIKGFLKRAGHHLNRKEQFVTLMKRIKDLRVVERVKGTPVSAQDQEKFRGVMIAIKNAKGGDYVKQFQTLAYTALAALEVDQAPDKGMSLARSIANPLPSADNPGKRLHKVCIDRYERDLGNYSLTLKGGNNSYKQGDPHFYLVLNADKVPACTEECKTKAIRARKHTESLQHELKTMAEKQIPWNADYIDKRTARAVNALLAILNPDGPPVVKAASTQPPEHHKKRNNDSRQQQQPTKKNRKAQ